MYDGHVASYVDRVKRIWYLSPMRAAKVQASLRIHAVSPEPPLLAHTSSESRGTFSQKARSLAPLNGWACAVKIDHDGMLEDTNSLEGAHVTSLIRRFFLTSIYIYMYSSITSCNAQYRKNVQESMNGSQNDFFFIFFFIYFFYMLALSQLMLIFRHFNNNKYLLICCC